MRGVGENWNFKCILLYLVYFGLGKFIFLFLIRLLNIIFMFLIKSFGIF